MAWGVQPAADRSLPRRIRGRAPRRRALLDDMIRLVVARAALMERVGGAGAAMMAVPLPESELLELLPATLSLAAVNSSDECVVSGPAEAVDALAATLADREVTGLRIPLAAAAHSSLLDPVLAEFLDVVRTVSLSAADDPLRLEFDRHMDHRRAGDRPAVLGRPSPRHRPLRRRTDRRAHREPTRTRRARPRPITVVVRPPQHHQTNSDHPRTTPPRRRHRRHRPRPRRVRSRLGPRLPPRHRPHHRLDQHADAASPCPPTPSNAPATGSKPPAAAGE